MSINSLCRTGGARCLIVLLVLVTGLLGFSSNACAQGTMGMLPDPVRTNELMQYGDRLGLSDGQRRAAQTIHDAYLRDFRELREGEIAELMTQTRQLQRTMMGMPDRELLDEVIRKWERARRQIRQLDERLFMQLQPMLTESQLRMLPRVQLARERRRISIMRQGASMGGSTIADLSNIIMQMDISPRELANVDGILEPYERRLTRDLSSLFDASMEMMTGMFDVMADLEFDPADMMNPERAQEFMEAMQQAMADLEAPVREATLSLQNYNSRTLRQVGSLLPDETARLLRHRFIRESFPNVADILRQTVERRFEAALLLEDLADDQREQIEFALRDLRDKRDRLVDAFVKAELDWIRDRSMFSFDPDDWRTRQETINEKQNKAKELDQEAMTTLKSILGDEQQELAESRLESVESRYREQVFEERTRPREDEPDTAPASAQRSGPDHYLPTTITRSDVTTYANILDLDDDERDVVNELYELYLETYAEIESDVIEKISGASRTQWTRIRDEDASLASLREEIVALYRLREQAMERIVEADNTMFNDIETVLFSEDSHPRMQRVRNHRLHQVYGSAARQNVYGGHRESDQDLLELARRAGLHRADGERLFDALREYEEERIALLKSRYATGLEIGRESDISQMEMMVRARENPDEVAFDYQEMNERIRRFQEPMRDFQRRLAELNRETLDSLRSVVSEDGYRTLRDTYYRRSFPSIFSDPTSIEDQLQQAMNLPGLSDSQRTELRELAASYRPSYNELTESMVVIRRENFGRVMGMGMPEDWQDAMHQREKLIKVQFERNELNARAIATLRSILRDEQIESIGGVPDPDDAETGGFGF